jgi:hypothetical protein
MPQRAADIVRKTGREIEEKMQPNENLRSFVLLPSDVESD